MTKWTAATTGKPPPLPSCPHAHQDEEEEIRQVTADVRKVLPPCDLQLVKLEFVDMVINLVDYPGQAPSEHQDEGYDHQGATAHPSPSRPRFIHGSTLLGPAAKPSPARRSTSVASVRSATLWPRRLSSSNQGTMG